MEGGPQADGLGEDGGAAGTANAVQRLVPPVIGLNAQAGNAGRLVHQLCEFLFERHLGDERIGALFQFLHGGLCCGSKGCQGE